MSFYNQARTDLVLTRVREKNLQANRFVLTPPQSSNNNFITYWKSNNRKADALTLTATLMADENPAFLKNFRDYSACLGRHKTTVKSHSKYRSIDGLGNNLKNPHWGRSGTPFTRFGPKTYDDGVYTIRKSDSGSDLPSPRRILRDVLLKADKKPRTSNIVTSMVNMLIVYVSHDMGQVVNVKGFEGEEIRCCSGGNRKVLSPSLQHSACIPISVSQNDPFYKTGNVKCLNMLRSELATSPSSLEFGEIMNSETAFIDQSLIYGSSDSITAKIRSYSKGRLNMGKGNVLPTDADGKYLKNTERFRVVPVVSVFITLFARNHNNLAEGLAKVNPSMEDETLFQEARRINIAMLQNFIFSSETIESLFYKKVNETYQEDVDPSTTVEFVTAAFRYFHSFAQSEMLLIDKQGQEKKFLNSDTFGRIDIVENSFEDYLRGTLAQPISLTQYSPEASFFAVYHRFRFHLS